MSQEIECEINVELNDVCEYLNIPVCCHPEYNAGEVDEDFCLKCKHRKIPIKGKAVSLLIELVKLSSNIGWELEEFIGTDNNPETQIPQQKLLCELSQKIDEVGKFLEAVGVNISEGESVDAKNTIRVKRRMGNRFKNKI